MILSRRLFVTAGAAAAFVSPRLLSAQGFAAYPFRLGVAAGDPSPDGFVIWTRLAPDPLAEHGGMPMVPVPVQYEVAADEGFKAIVRKGDAVAPPELAHSVHVELAGLEPDRPYWYRFTTGPAGLGRERSIIGRARTLPATHASLASVKFGVCGCQNYEDGYYTAYRALAKEDLAFVYHYGDYIYEGRGSKIGVGYTGGLSVHAREHVGQTCYDLADYRRRYAQYKSDADLQAAHAKQTWFATFDDHEVENDWAGETDPFATPPALFRLRRAAAFQAWYEHMPVRAALMPHGDAINMHRGAAYGDLMAMHFLDTRQFRTHQPCDGGFKPICPGMTDPNATMISAEEERWLAENLAHKSGRWNMIAQQVMMMAIDRRVAGEAEEIRNMDSWAGYEVPRRRVLSRMRGLDNVVVLTGDEHQNYAGLLHDKDVPVAVEFVSTSISSGGDGSDLRKGTDKIRAENPQLKFMNDQRGYLVCEVGRDAWQSHFMVADRVSTPDGTVSKRATLTVARGAVAIEGA
jgi:alkaline phosphatase D